MKNRYVDGLKYPKSHPFRTNSEKMLDAFHNDIYIENGVVRWKASGNVPPTDILNFWNFIGFDFDYDKTIQTQQKETEDFLGSYTRNQKTPSAEELFEMQTAFGKGVDIIDVASGKHYRT